MKLLHTSDWHLGRTLYAKKERQNEHAAFLAWLLQTVKERAVDLLLIAGDVFDTASPSGASQKMYYDFLLKVRNSGCTNVIVVGGNHDSPGFLNAPKEILAAINVTVVGNAGENIEDEVISIKNGNGETVAIVCAVPFLRERDISRHIENETYAGRSQRIAESIKNHYAAVAGIAESRKRETVENIPVIATGHLSVAGGKTTGGDGVRETYIGNIECIGSEIFPKTFDYVALGHYHIPSVIGKNIRYCGSPIPMGFGEAEQRKSVCLVDFGNGKPEIATVDIPVFQQLKSIRGDKSSIEKQLSELKKQDIPVWIELIYDGNDVFPDFTAWAAEQTANTKIEILKLQNRQYLTEVLTFDGSLQSLDELNQSDVFDKLLEKNAVPDEQKATYRGLYDEIIANHAMNIKHCKCSVLNLIIILLLTVSCAKSFDEKVKDSVRNQLSVYPQSSLQDIYKNFFQDRFGPGHLIPDTAMAGEYLREELNSYTEDSQNPPLEPIGWEGNYYRVSLAVLKHGAVPADVYVEAFVESANSAAEVSSADWKNEWERIAAVIEKMNLALPGYESDKAKIRDLIEKGDFAVHHSPVFENAYHPHYRVIKKEIVLAKIKPLLPVYAELLAF